MLFSRFLLSFSGISRRDSNATVFARDSQNSTILHHCKVTDSDVRDLSFGSGWVRLGRASARRRRMRGFCKRNPNTAKSPSRGPEMPTIVLTTQKGGSGKSTLAISLTLAAIRAGHNARLIETDPQGTVSNWKRRRPFAAPIVEPIYAAREVERRLQSLAHTGVTVTI